MVVSRRQLLRMAGILGVAGAAGCSTASRSDGTERRTDSTATSGNPGDVAASTTPTEAATTRSDGSTARDDTATTARGRRDYDTVRVPGDHETIQGGVDAASTGDLVLVAPGTYAEEVVVSTPAVTVRGRDRNDVVLDGEFERRNGVEVKADGVALENLTGRHYQGTAFYWSGVEGFRGSFLTAYTNGYYGVYAYDSRDGRFEHSYASGHPDAGFYLGRNRPYDAVITDVVAEHNMIGYSGTSTGGSLTVRDSVWRHNKVGLFPNTLDRADPPQSGSTLLDNEVYENNNPDAPALSSYPLVGMGVLLWGAADNVVARNQVHDHDNFGIVAQHHVVEPSGNEIRDNQVGDSGEADLALGRPVGDGNDFHDNEFETSRPRSIESDASSGSEAVTDVFAELEAQLESGDFPAGDWQDQPTPGDQSGMSDPTAPPRPADVASSWAAPQPQTEGYRR